MTGYNGDEFGMVANRAPRRLRPWARWALPAATALVLTACSGSVTSSTFRPGPRIASVTHSRADGTPISLRRIVKSETTRHLPPGQRLYTLRYWSRGVDVQGYLDVPSGHGPFPLVLYLHGGLPTPEPSHWSAGDLTYNALAAAEAASPGTIVFMPNYGGYGPSRGTICSPYDCSLDAANGLKALRRVEGLHVKSGATYLIGFSLGGYVAMQLAEGDSAVRAAVLDSPWLGAQTYEAWAQRVQVANLGAYDLSIWTMVVSAFGQDPKSNLMRENSIQFGRLHVPVLLIGGTRDPAVPPSQVRFLYSQMRLGGVHVTMRFFSAGHAPITPQVHTLVRTWLLAQHLRLVWRP